MIVDFMPFNIKVFRIRFNYLNRKQLLVRGMLIVKCCRREWIRQMRVNLSNPGQKIAHVDRRLLTKDIEVLLSTYTLLLINEPMH